MMMMPMSMEITALLDLEPVPEPEPADPTTEELYSLAVGINAIIEHIDTSIDKDHENADNLYDMKDFLEEVLLEMQADYERKGL